MSYIVYLYAEGGTQDGEDFACGPYGDWSNAETAEGELAGRGQTRILALYPGTADLLRELSPE